MSKTTERIDEGSAAPADPSISHRPHRRDIQGLRALAVVLVVAFHTGLPLSGGFVGVDVFFVISGFVITGMLADEQARTGSIRLSTFYARRVRRILPALAVMLAVVAILSVFLLSPLGPQQLTAKTGAAASVFLANVQLAANPAGYFDPIEIRNALLHTWSLSVEEQFYLVYPALLIGVGSLVTRGRKRRAPAGLVATVLGGVALASFVWSWRLSTATGSAALAGSARFAFYSSPTRAWEFLAGAVLALLVPQLRRLSSATAVVAGGLGLALVVATAVQVDARTPFPGTAALVPVLGTCLLIISGTATTRGVSALLGTRPAVWIGDLSYSWYLWHWPFIVFAASIWPHSGTTVAVLAAATALVPAVVSYAVVENRFRFRSDLVGRRAVPLALACIVIPAVMCLSIVAGSRLLQSPDTRALVSAHALHADEVRGCDNLSPVAHRAADCTWSVPDAKGTVYLVGDSNAGHVTEPAAAAANALGYDFVAATSSGCGFADLISIEDGVELGRCRAHVVEAMGTFEASRPSAVLISSSTPDIIWDDSRALKDPYTGEIATTRAEKLGLYQRTLTTELDRLERAGVHVVLVHTVPQFARWDPIDCGLAVYLSPRSCATTAARSEIEQGQAPYRHAEDGALAAVPAATALDLADDLCEPTSCSSRRDDVWMYRDGGHLSIPGAISLTPRFESALQAALASPTPTP